MPRSASWDPDRARTLIAELSPLEGPLLPILHTLQDAFGYVDAAAIPLIADALNLSQAEVFGTLSFYDDFRDAPPPRRLVKLCRAEACQALGCEDLVDGLARSQGIAPDVHGDGTAVEVHSVYCLGNCALGPSALVDDTLIGRLDADRLAVLCDPDRKVSEALP